MIREHTDKEAVPEGREEALGGGGERVRGDRGRERERERERERVKVKY